MKYIAVCIGLCNAYLEAATLQHKNNAQEHPHIYHALHDIHKTYQEQLKKLRHLEQRIQKLITQQEAKP